MTLITKEKDHLIFDCQHLAGFTGNDAELEREVLQTFLKRLPEYLGVLNDLDGADWVEQLHKIKGAARAVGCFRLAHCSAQLEDYAALKGPLKGLNDTVKNILWAHYIRARWQITAHLSDTDTG